MVQNLIKQTINPDILNLKNTIVSKSNFIRQNQKAIKRNQKVF